MPTGNVSHAFTIGATGGSNAIPSTQWSVTSDIGTDIDVTVAGGVTDQLYTLAVNHATLKDFLLIANGPITVCVNAASTGAPAFTWGLVANVPLVWSDQMVNAKPMGTTDITALYLTVPGGTAVRLRGLVGHLN